MQRIDALFAIEHEINCLGAEERLAVRKEQLALLVADLEARMRIPNDPDHCFRMIATTDSD